EHQSLPAGERRVRFEGLASGIYQLRLHGSVPTEQLGTKIAIGNGDVRSTTITVQPFTVTGHITFGGTNLGTGALVLRHPELHWRAAIPIGTDGTFRAPFWQRGTFTSDVRSPALPTSFNDTVDLADGMANVALNIAIPDGRITGIVRDQKTGAPVPNAVIGLQTDIANGEQHVRLLTGPDGKFDFAGIRYGKHTVRVYPPQHLEPEPIAFTLDDSHRLRELDVRVDAGRAVAFTVIDRDNDPVANAKVFAVTEGKLRARTTTDEDGRATVAVPAGESATLVVIGEEGPFGMLRIPREQEGGRLQLHLPRSTSSLLIRAQTTTGATMPQFSLLMRYNGVLVPTEVAEELANIQGVQLMTDANSDVNLQNIPSGSYEFWPYRTDDEAEAIVSSADAVLAPIQVNVKTGENKIAVKFASKLGMRR
ncbi:MAG TPA: carboxypeptidase-like regulatory domain-containing protein, partial [Thermoanaerobaculia bacterium]